MMVLTFKGGGIHEGEFKELVDFCKKLENIYGRRRVTVIAIRSDAHVRLGANDAGIDLSPLKPVVFYDEFIEKNIPVIAETGVKIKLGDNLVGLVVPRSSLPVKLGLTVANNLGVIDCNYRGDVKLILQVTSRRILENSEHTKVLAKGILLKQHTRLAQLLLVPCVYPARKTDFFEEHVIHIVKNTEFYERFEEIFPSERGSGGIGSTG